jgi:hypothetical protein
MQLEANCAVSESFTGFEVRRPRPNGNPSTNRLPPVCHWLCQCLVTSIDPSGSNGGWLKRGFERLGDAVIKAVDGCVAGAHLEEVAPDSRRFPSGASRAAPPQQLAFSEAIRKTGCACSATRRRSGAAQASEGFRISCKRGESPGAIRRRTAVGRLRWEECSCGSTTLGITSNTSPNTA